MSTFSDEELRTRWLRLTRDVLPGMAAKNGWPIRLDHCFMRVCLDHAVGRRWDTVVARPAIRHLDPVQLARAVACAEAIVADPASLPGLNDASLLMRGHKPASGSRALRQRNGGDTRRAFPTEGVNHVRRAEHRRPLQDDRDRDRRA